MDYDDICDIVAFNLSLGIRVEETLRDLEREDLIDDLKQFNYLCADGKE